VLYCTDSRHRLVVAINRGKPVAESARKCMLCGLPLKMFAGLMINGESYHDFCWEGRDRTAPKVPAAKGPDGDSNASA